MYKQCGSNQGIYLFTFPIVVSFLFHKEVKYLKEVLKYYSIYAYCLEKRTASRQLHMSVFSKLVLLHDRCHSIACWKTRYLNINNCYFSNYHCFVTTTINFAFILLSYIFLPTLPILIHFVNLCQLPIVIYLR